MEITIDQLKNYLGTGLILEYKGHGDEKPFIVDRWSVSVHKNWDIHFKCDIGTDDDVLFYFKPVCYRLSDLDKEIEVNGERFVPLDMLNKRSTALTLYRMETENKTCLVFDTAVHGYNVLSSFNKVQQLFEWHFWPFGDEYFEQGLVIDKMKNVC